MKNVLMVCLGNICRSPMAEGVLRDLAAKKNVDVDVDSCGTGHWHIGHSPDSRAISTMRKHGIDIGNLKARQFQPEDFDRFDLILTMDKSNHRDICNMASNADQRDKVKMALPNGDVPDPYTGKLSDFEHVYNLLVPAMEKHLDALK